jgi:hypothetical protein
VPDKRTAADVADALKRLGYMIGDFAFLNICPSPGFELKLGRRGATLPTGTRRQTLSAAGVAYGRPSSGMAVWWPVTAMTARAVDSDPAQEPRAAFRLKSWTGGVWWSSEATRRE